MIKKKTTEKKRSTHTIQTIAPRMEALYEKEKILKHQIQTNEKILVAVSGGADSILTACLLYNFFVQEKYNIDNLFFIHCNHWTRIGNTQDEIFVKEFFEKTQLIIVKRKKWGKKTEAELRKWRYGEFKKYAKKFWIKKIIFWHNLTDRIESTFLNLLRGANLNGFIAMQTNEPHHLLWDIQVFRPILQRTKDEVFDLCKIYKIPFVTDPTNKDDTTSLRNKLRNKVFPELYKLANKQTKTTNSFIESMKNIYTSLEEANKKKNLYSSSDTKSYSQNWTLNSKWWTLYTIKKSPHRKATFAYQRMIDSNKITNELMIQVMKKLHISNNVTTPLLKELTKFLTNSESGYKYFNNTYIFKSHGNIYIISAPKGFWEKTVDSEKKIDTITVKRFPRKSDTYKKKTRNQRCINHKIPIFRRNFIPVVAQENQIIKYTWKKQ